MAVSLLVGTLVFVNSSMARAWDPITHYHINRMANPGGFGDSHLFCSGGTGPDMLLLVTRPPCVEYAHAPHPLDNGKWRSKPNFAYLMLKINGLDNTHSEGYIAAEGWGGHIAADWVAHTGNK